MKIAIIGSGVAGLTSAYLLAADHEVTIYEKGDRIGGHAHTLLIENGNTKVPVDNGFMVFNPSEYPNFVKLLGKLGVRSRKTTMTFGVSIPNKISYKGTIPNGIFADRRNVFNVRFLKFLREIIRFQKVAKRELKTVETNNETLVEFLSRHSFTDDLAQWWLFPLLSAIWSIKESNKVGNFPALATFRFLNNHKLLNSIRPKWQTVEGGSITYVSKIQQYIEEHGAKILLHSNITKISRYDSVVSITADDVTDNFDYVLFATHADTTSALLSDITEEEKTALDKFTFSHNTTVLHGDTRFVPSNKRAIAAWNYTEVQGPDARSQAMFTYCMNILQHIPKSFPVFVTLNPQAQIEQSKIFAVEEYTHPEYNLDTLEGQKLIAALQGQRRTLFAGAYLGYGFHEDGVISAIEALKHIDVTPPWR